MCGGSRSTKCPRRFPAARHRQWPAAEPEIGPSARKTGERDRQTGRRPGRVDLDGRFGATQRLTSAPLASARRAQSGDGRADGRIATIHVAGTMGATAGQQETASSPLRTHVVFGRAVAQGNRALDASEQPERRDVRAGEPGHGGHRRGMSRHASASVWKAVVRQCRAIGDDGLTPRFDRLTTVRGPDDCADRRAVRWGGRGNACEPGAHLRAPGGNSPGPQGNHV